MFIDYRPQENGKLINTTEPDIEQVDELAKLGLAKVGSRGDIQFGNEWSTRRLDAWLQELLPAAFKHNDLAPDEEYTWRLLKSHRPHLSFHRELPDGVCFGTRENYGVKVQLRITTALLDDVNERS